MRQLSPAGQQVINDIAQRNGFSVEATLSMLDSVINGNGSQAQFNHPEFSGSGQWMRGGMIMLSDMFNNPEGPRRRPVQRPVEPCRQPAGPSTSFR